MTIAPPPIPAALNALYGARDLLARAFPDHAFTIDGKIIGDIGEAIAIKAFGLQKLAAGSKDHDLRTSDGRLVQVKATQKAPGGRAVGLGSVKTTFDILLVIEFDHEGRFDVLFNGPGWVVDDARAHKAGASLSRNQLRACQSRVPSELQLPLVAPDPEQSVAK